MFPSVSLLTVPEGLPQLQPRQKEKRQMCIKYCLITGCEKEGKKGWGREGQGTRVGAYNGARIKAKRKTHYKRPLFLQQATTNLNQVT